MLSSADRRGLMGDGRGCLLLDGRGLHAHTTTVHSLALPIPSYTGSISPCPALLVPERQAPWTRPRPPPASPSIPSRPFRLASLPPSSRSNHGRRSVPSPRPHAPRLGGLADPWPLQRGTWMCPWMFVVDQVSLDTNGPPHSHQQDTRPLTHHSPYPPHCRTRSRPLLQSAGTLSFCCAAARPARVTFCGTSSTN